MLKITRVHRTPSGWLLRLEGSVVGAAVETLREYCELALRDGGTLTLDLSDVGFADPSGLSLLRELDQRSVMLSGHAALATVGGGVR